MIARSVNKSLTSRIGSRSLNLRGHRVFSSRQILLNLPQSPKSSYTVLNNGSNDEREAFFKYSWGSWAKDDTGEKAKRYTPFRIEGVADILNQALDVPETVTSPAVKSITSLSEGKHHRIYLIEASNESQYILRLPYPLDLSKEARKRRLQSEVATMDFVSKKWGLLVPKVLSWCPTDENPIEREYILMEYIGPKGSSNVENLMRKWDPMNSDVAARAKVLKTIVELLEKILATRFNAFGSLYFTQDVSTELQNKLPYNDETDNELIDRWRIGPSVEKCFWQNGIDGESDVNRGPWSTPEEYLVATANSQLVALQNLLNNESTNRELKKYLPTWISVYKKYSELAPHLIPKLPNDSDVLSPRLYHPDLSPLNVLVDCSVRDEASNEIFTNPYLLDWEGSTIKPFFLHGAPEFVQYNGYKVFKKEEVAGYDQLPSQQRAQVDFMIAATTNQFSFEFMFNQFFPTLINSYSPNVKLIRDPYRAAMSADYRYHPMEIVDFRDALIKTQKEWPFIFDSEPPFNFSESEIAEHSTELQQWEQIISGLPFFSTKGWMPQDMFESAVNSGDLLKDKSGDYVNKK
ncbi:kinase-like domain-containing protein [Dipodascopsis uninucleata]